MSFVEINFRVKKDLILTIIMVELLAKLCQKAGK